jgi:hypothetical protein
MKSSDHNHLHILAPKASPKEVLRLLNKYSLSTEIEHYDYGTAGFRLDARHLPGLMMLSVWVSWRLFDALRFVNMSESW